MVLFGAHCNQRDDQADDTRYCKNERNAAICSCAEPVTNQRDTHAQRVGLAAFFQVSAGVERYITKQIE